MILSDFIWVFAMLNEWLLQPASTPAANKESAKVLSFISIFSLRVR